MLVSCVLYTSGVHQNSKSSMGSPFVMQSEMHNSNIKWASSLQVNGIGTFETVWQVKFYNYHKRDHCQWGNSFGCIEYECKPNETRSLMWINKETFY